ncbi:hypothetical protein HU200_018033 [Digitaria exilis]|uniref:DUF4220 domain-containing protein n=1 Tax=Digitaria exilis TaxID=1010633 RepID=A0A835F5I2_9POAL|nr:hypothetical protein HU200_018033 [Digitaria exilis]
MALLSGARRRSSPSLLLWVVPWILGAAYQGADMAVASAIGSLSLCDSNASEAAEQQLIAFWAPFLLVQLAGPDNMTASTLEDNTLSVRKFVEMTLQYFGVLYTITNYLYYGGGHNSRVLFKASFIMILVGWAKYVERAGAQLLAKRLFTNSVAMWTSEEEEELSSRRLDDMEALLLAQDLFHVWRRALADASVEPESASHRTGEKIFCLGWESMCKVVEMELSLMYELLYTKAMVARVSWPFHVILRLVSPPATAAAASLFWIHHKSENGGRINGSFYGITYLLLGAAFAMDVVWLLRALGSIWTYYFLKMRAWPWLHHHMLCSGRWIRLHRLVVSLDPLRLLFGIDPISYRRWSGTIGRYNLLHECTTSSSRCGRSCQCCRWLATKTDTRYLSELPETANKLLFKRIRRILPTGHRDDDAYTMVDITTCWGQEALRRGEAEELFGNDVTPMCAREFEEDVLMWHVATCIYLSRARVRKLPNSSPTGRHVEAIKAMSEYLMFLVAKRRHMLPGLVLHSLLEETRMVLKHIWSDAAAAATAGGEGGGGGGGKKSKATRLATLLRRERQKQGARWANSYGKRLVFDAATIAGTLTTNSMRRRKVARMLELIFNVWVDKLLYASIRCSRESHAKQLSVGGELTTVIWMVVHHAGPFQIGHEMPADEKKLQAEEHQEKKLKETKKKMSAADEKPAWWPYDGYVPYPVPTADEEPEEEDDQEEEDPDDAQDYKTPVEFITLY